MFVCVSVYTHAHTLLYYSILYCSIIYCIIVHTNTRHKDLILFDQTRHTPTLSYSFQEYNPSVKCEVICAVRDDYSS